MIAFNRYVEVKEAIDDGLTQRAIMSKFNLTSGTVVRIRNTADYSDFTSRVRARKHSSINVASANPNWSGDKVGYHGLHSFVKKRLPKPNTCDDCHEQPPRDLANKGIYDRNLENWEWLCRRCHMIKDGRMNNLRQFA